MNTETEVKFLNVTHDEVRTRLQNLGAVCVAPMRLMKRAIIDYPDRRLQVGEVNAYIRIRDEGDKVTLTYKQFTSLSVSGAKEVETTVSSFEAAIKIFTAIGLVVTSYQETKRETWQYGESEIVLDVWPWLKPYIEIEAEAESVCRAVSEQLGFDWAEAVFGDVMVAYRAEYPHLGPNDTVGTVPVVTFEVPPPDFLQIAPESV